MKEVCWHCRWWALDESYIGKRVDDYFSPCSCKRHAPIERRKAPGSGEVYAAWPSTKARDWCGDWEGRDVVDEVRRGHISSGINEEIEA